MKPSPSFISSFWQFVRDQKNLLGIILAYGMVASFIGFIIPLSIQYLTTVIMANATTIPIFFIISCLILFLCMYVGLKIVQMVIFSHFEKRFFILNVAKIAHYLLSHPSSPYSESSKEKSFTEADILMRYAEILSINKHVASFLFVTSAFIQQVIVGIAIISFYNLGFFLFSIILVGIVCLMVRFYFLPSVSRAKEEYSSRYQLANHLDRMIRSSLPQQESKLNDLLKNYYTKKSHYFGIVLNQTVAFFSVYVLANGLFLLLSAILTLKGFITIPQFVAAEIVYAMIFAGLAEFTKSLKDVYDVTNSFHHLSEIAYPADSSYLPAYIHSLIASPSYGKNFLKWIGALLIALLVGLVVIPWWQSSGGSGQIVALDPSERIQDIQAPLSGRVSRWRVNDGMYVHKGSPLVDITDNDPDIAQKLAVELEAVRVHYTSALSLTRTSKLNYDRQSMLYHQGLTSRKEFEKAKMDYEKQIAYQQEVQAKLIQTDIKRTRQLSQTVIAPRDGFLIQPKMAGGFVYGGEKLATFIPKINGPAIELYLKPMDAPLLRQGLKARIQIEGWPALRIAGWPATSLGTYGGVVSMVDSGLSANGMLRVLIVPDKYQAPWPHMKFLRQGGRIRGWVIMNKVSLGYEIWRQINGFPMNPYPHIFEVKEKKDTKEKDGDK